MGNLFDYLAWRGDLSFGNSPLTPIDALAFSMLSYMRLHHVMPTDVRAEPMRLSEVAKAYFALPELPCKDKNHQRLLKEMAASVRYGSLRLFGARQYVNREDGTQFGALSVLLPARGMFAAFEGTDDTIVGWKEDFRMSYECPVPAQAMAKDYLKEVSLVEPLRRIWVGGHSKGGNLAMYAAIFAPPECRSRIRAVYNNDGPGFCDSTIYLPEYREMRHLIHTYLPQSSIVAVLLEHDENYRIVRSTNHGIMQHDAYSWEICGPDFVYTNERTTFGRNTEAIIDHFVNAFSPERKRRFNEALFGILEASEQETISGITRNKRKSLANIWRAYTELDPQVKKVLTECLSELRHAKKALGKKENPRIEAKREALAAARREEALKDKAKSS